MSPRRRRGVAGRVLPLAELDRDIAWRAFLLAWLRVHEHRPVTANELRASAEDCPAVWAGTFPRTMAGELPSARSVGRILTHRLHRVAGDLVLRSVTDAHTKTRVYWVQRGPTSPYWFDQRPSGPGSTAPLTSGRSLNDPSSVQRPRRVPWPAFSERLTDRANTGS